MSNSDLDLKNVAKRSAISMAHPFTISMSWVQRSVLAVLLLLRLDLSASCCCTAMVNGAIAADCKAPCQCCCADSKLQDRTIVRRAAD